MQKKQYLLNEKKKNINKKNKNDGNNKKEKISEIPNTKLHLEQTGSFLKAQNKNDEIKMTDKEKKYNEIDETNKVEKTEKINTKLKKEETCQKTFEESIKNEEKEKIESEEN